MMEMTQELVKKEKKGTTSGIRLEESIRRSKLGFYCVVHQTSFKDVENTKRHIKEKHSNDVCTD